MPLIPIILSGGSGSRLWPVSRLTRPKPFIRLSDGESLLQKAFLRAAHLPEVAEVITVTNRELFFQSDDDLRPVNVGGLPMRYILEPFGRNTAPAAIAAALEVVEHYGEDATLLVLAADHMITDYPAFADAVAKACVFAQAGKLVTFGITPDSPQTGFGYIEAEGNTVRRFVEKPDLARAKEYLAAGNFYWNSGMFCFTAKTLLAQMAQHAPDMLAATKTAMAAARRSAGEGLHKIELQPESFGAVPDDSIDYALMERSSDVAVVPCSIGWSDIGSWNALGDLAQSADANGNRVEGEAVLHNAHNCFIQSTDRVVGAVGVDDLIIVDTPDALLVAHKDTAQDVKHLFTELKERAHETHHHHRTVHRPWGTYTVIEEGAGFKIKRIMVKPHASLSLQMHAHRSEHWIVVSGRAAIVNGEVELQLPPNHSTYIPAGNKHRLSNPLDEPLIIIEIQTGGYLEEDDIVRFDDVYGRA